MKTIIQISQDSNGTHIRKIGYSATSESGARANAYGAERDAFCRWDLPEAGVYGGGVCVDVSDALQAILDDGPEVDRYLALGTLVIVDGVLHCKATARAIAQDEAVALMQIQTTPVTDPRATDTEPALIRMFAAVSRGMSESDKDRGDGRVTSLGNPS